MCLVHSLVIRYVTSCRVPRIATNGPTHPPVWSRLISFPSPPFDWSVDPQCGGWPHSAGLLACAGHEVPSKTAGLQLAELWLAGSWPAQCGMPLATPTSGLPAAPCGRLRSSSAYLCALCKVGQLLFYFECSAQKAVRAHKAPALSSSRGLVGR